MSVLRVLTLPVQITREYISFGTAIIRPHDIWEHGDQVLLYFDESKQPRFSRAEDRKGWCSPPADVIRQHEEAGLPVDTYQLIVCSCQNQTFNLSVEDLASLQYCGHAAKCPKATARSMTLVEALSASGFVQPQAAIVPEKPPAEPPPAPPTGGLTDEALSNLIAHLDGSRESMVDAMASIHWMEPFNEAVVAAQLAKVRFTRCQGSGCNTWSHVKSLSSPRCGNCA